ncbi:hypothetical protein [Desulfurobacterium atlanticum]|uniref:Uncharacterized protein n=1 Tax=Desulfurobacterium atlanticum TaxID=240169 RepID=A0A239A271_9BACT|nr:hypothetical protein [Desulfurobacterium atlanticum]SNR88993.1 hypothetical protein SAMN06265340_1142 [Desulfurobacterium atlanticum]
MECSEPGFAFRVTFKKVNYVELEKPVATDYDRLTIKEKEILLYLLENPEITKKTEEEVLKAAETKVKKEKSNDR